MSVFFTASGNALAAARPGEAILADIERVAGLEQPVIRNLWITQHYHSLMGLLSDVLGGGNANWSTFATWASKTAGQSIRGEEVPVEIQQLLIEQAKVQERLSLLLEAMPGNWAERLDPLAIPKAVLARVSEQIALGNLKVFAELAPLFAQFWDRFSDPSRLTEAELDAFVGGLKKGPAERDGQDSLKVAFTSYFAGALRTNEKEKAEYLLYGNLLIGLHEQTRLQSFIASAMDAPFDEQSYEPLLAAQPNWLEKVTRPAFRGLLTALRKDCEQHWEHLATRYMMTLTLPGGNLLHLGKDIPVGSAPFPTVLNPLEYQALKELVSSYDPNLSSLKGSAARNWTELGNRMAFIADLFRSRQQDSSLFKPPFSDEQLAALALGTRPSGPL
ncbi:MAG TPA: hypothetical protein VER96_26485 [Polyangiaceae bacterium]|nr:hypothetical protein [Polyangiaceae bacterium]